MLLSFKFPLVLSQSPAFWALFFLTAIDKEFDDLFVVAARPGDSELCNILSPQSPELNRPSRVKRRLSPAEVWGMKILNI